MLAGFSIVVVAEVILLQMYFMNSVEKALRIKGKALEFNANVNKRNELALSEAAHFDNTNRFAYALAEKNGNSSKKFASAQ